VAVHPAVSSLEACPTPARELRRVITYLLLRADIRQPLTTPAIRAFQKFALEKTGLKGQQT